jgi:hypothetical protein
MKAGGITIEHVFMPWEDVDLNSLDQADAYARQRGRRLLVTLEPRSWSPALKTSSAEPRDGLLAGNFDERLSTTCGKLSKLKSSVGVRWGTRWRSRTSAVRGRTGSLPTKCPPTVEWSTPAERAHAACASCGRRAVRVIWRITIRAMPKSMRWACRCSGCRLTMNCSTALAVRSLTL